MYSPFWWPTAHRTATILPSFTRLHSINARSPHCAALMMVSRLGAWPCTIVLCVSAIDHLHCFCVESRGIIAPQHPALVVVIRVVNHVRVRGQIALLSVVPVVTLSPSKRSSRSA